MSGTACSFLPAVDEASRRTLASRRPHRRPIIIRGNTCTSTSSPQLLVGAKKYLRWVRGFGPIPVRVDPGRLHLAPSTPISPWSEADQHRTLSLAMSGHHPFDKHTVLRRRDRRWKPGVLPYTIVHSTGQAIVADHKAPSVHKCHATANYSRPGHQNCCETWMTYGRRLHHAVRPQAVCGHRKYMETKTCIHLLWSRPLRSIDRLQRCCPSSGQLSNSEGHLYQARDRSFCVSTARVISSRERQQIATVCSHLFALQSVALLTHHKS